MRFSNCFIQRQKRYGTEEQPLPAPMFRRKFTLSAAPESAAITICGLGFYRLYVNGHEITKGFLAPYVSNPDEVLCYDTYTVNFEAGENVIAVLLGNGLLNNPCGSIWDFDTAPYRDAPKFALCAEADGKVLFCADERFVSSDSPIIFDDYRGGEQYDARLEQPGWTDIEFDDSEWRPAVYAVIPKGKPHIVDCEPLIVAEEREPVSVTPTEGGYIYSFRYNDAGVCRLSIRGKRGQVVRLTHGEVVLDGRLDMTNITFQRSECPKHTQNVVYILKGEECECYVPSFTYFGFQHVFVQGITPEQATPELLTYLVIHSDIREAGRFECSDEVFNRLSENTRRSTLSNFYYYLTDCPHREKNGWLGDAAVSAEHVMLNLHAGRSLREWLFHVRQAQWEDGRLPGIVPTSGWGIEWGNGPGWDTAIVQLTYYIAKYTANTDVIHENLDAIFRYLAYARSRENADGLLAFGLGDWCQTGRDSSEYETELEVTDTLIIMEACEKTARMCAAVGDGRGAEADAYRSVLRKRFRRKYVAGGRLLEKYATQTALAMSVCCGVFEESELAAAVRQLLSRIHADGDRMNVGIFGGRTLFRALSRCGYVDLACKLIEQPDFPSYAYQLSYGATTLWEDFRELLPGRLQIKNGRKINSLNHHFWGDISAWFMRDIAGLRINPGLKDPLYIEIRPICPAHIDYARAERDYLGEKIAVEWRRTPTGIKVNVTASDKFRVRRFPAQTGIHVIREESKQTVRETR